MDPIERNGSNRPDHPGATSTPPPNGQTDRQQPGLLILCPYCGCPSDNTRACSHCGGHFDLLSRQRTQNGMGPWFIRDQVKPFHPGCSYATLRRLAQRGRLHPDTIIRGPTTRQFWSFARSTPGVSHLVGLCHACGAPANPNQSRCDACDSSFLVSNDRQHLGLAPPQLLPGDAGTDAVADAAFGRPTAAQPPTGAPPMHANGTASTAGPAPSPSPSLTPLNTAPAIASPRRAGRRRRSLAPAIIVSSAVLLAAAVIAVVLVVTGSVPPTQPAGTTASTDGATSDAAEESSSASTAPAALSDTGRSPDLDAGPDPDQDLDPTPEPTPEPGEPAVTADGEPASDPVDAAESEPAVPAEPSPKPAAQAVPTPLVRLAGLDLDELGELRNQWVNDSEVPKDWLAALDRRVQQLELAAGALGGGAGRSDSPGGTD